MADAIDLGTVHEESVKKFKQKWRVQQFRSLHCTPNHQGECSQAACVCASGTLACPSRRGVTDLPAICVITMGVYLQ